MRFDLQITNSNNINYNYNDSNNKENKFSAKSEKENFKNFENKEAKSIYKEYNNLQHNSTFILDESIICDFKNNMHNENLSSISKYFKRGSAKYNENIFYDKNFNPENNQINVIAENVEDVKEINKEIKDMLDKVMDYKAKAYLSFKANRINEAMKDYLNVKIFNFN